MARVKRVVLSERSSSRQLWEELQKVRRYKGEPTQESVDLRAEVERMRVREASLLNQLAAATGEASTEGIAPNEAGGKPSLAKYRLLWRKFTDAVFRLPAVRNEKGWLAAQRSIATDLVGDLQLFELAEPRGPIEARLRVRIRRHLTSPAFQAVLMRDEPWADTMRVQFVVQAAYAFYRPALWKLNERAPDEGVLDRYGTVYK